MTVSNRHRARRVTKSRVTGGAVSKYYLDMALLLDLVVELVLDQELGLQSLSWSWSWNSWFFVLALASLDVPLELELDKELVLDQELEHLRGCCWRLLGL